VPSQNNPHGDHSGDHSSSHDQHPGQNAANPANCLPNCVIRFWIGDKYLSGSSDFVTIRGVKEPRKAIGADKEAQGSAPSLALCASLGVVDSNRMRRQTGALLFDDFLAHAFGQAHSRQVAAYLANGIVNPPPGEDFYDVVGLA